ncbi:MAG: hypothetical protein ACOCRO_06895 [Halanaerobiales bacterium]
MISAYLHRKFSEISEDLLTSVVFSRLRYLDHKDILIPFLKEAYLYDLKRTRLDEYLYELSIDLLLYQDVIYYFWPKHNVLGEPDLILIFTNHLYNKDDFLLLIEIKYKSGKSGTGENDQLMRYYHTVNERINEFDNICISNFNGITGPMIYLTELTAYSEIEASKDELLKEVKKVNQAIFHLEWKKLHSILKKELYTNKDSQFLIIKDLINFLAALNLIEYDGITLPDRELLNIVSKNYNIFYKEDGYIINNKYFNELPQLSNYDAKEYYFFRGVLND